MAILTLDSAAPPWAHLLVAQINRWLLASPAVTGGTINGTAINNSTIGLTTPGAAAFTTVNVGSFTATQLGTTGVVLSGTYTPTLTGVTNVTGTTAYACQYMRVGNVVNVSGKLDVDPTLVAATAVGISLPIASTLSAAEKCSGIAASDSIASEVAAINADVVANRAQMTWVTVSLANHSMYFDFQYLIT